MATTISISDGPAQKNYRPYRGDTFGRSFKIKVGGVYADISADTLKLTVKNNIGEQLYQLTIGSGITLGPGTGQASWKFTHTQMQTFPVAITTYYDIEWTRASDGNVKTVQAGTMVCTKDQTPP